MSKSQNKRLRRKKHGARPKRPAKKQAPVSWTWKDKLVLWGIIIGMVMLVLTILGLIVSQAYHRALDGRIQQWKTKYDLNESQVQQLKTIESEFHAYEKPFTFRSPPTQLEKEEHRKQITKILGVRNSAEFMKNSSSH